MKYIFSLSICCFIFFNNGFSQEDQISILPEYKKINKGKIYVLFGWNWARYTKSDIHFIGENHNFTLQKVKAQDRPSPFKADLYFNPKNLSIPQTNLKVGYFFHQNWNLAFGIDHMKYVVQQYQDVKIDGTINEQTYFDGNYNNHEINLTRGFLEYEHTDGLNYVYFEINRADRILKTRYFDVSLTEGFSTAALIPRSDVVLLGKEERDKYRMSGYGFGLKAAINFTFFNYFYIQTEAKGGFIHLPHVKTTSNNIDKAQQSFFYFQNNILFGALFPIVKKEKRLPKVKD